MGSADSGAAGYHTVATAGVAFLTGLVSAMGDDAYDETLRGEVVVVEDDEGSFAVIEL